MKIAKLPDAALPLSEQLEAWRATKKSIDSANAKQELLQLVRAWLSEKQQALKETFLSDNDVDTLLSAHSALMDALLSALYHLYSPGASPVALVAVGGYGRRELFPYSDIDLLFLYSADHEKEAARIAESILYVLWDIGLKVGQAHRTIEETLALAKEDISIRTNLLDARFIAGRQALCATFESRFQREIIDGSASAFIEAKLAERDARHLRFGDSRYMLEPNVKEGKGGLRDLHTVWWMARYAYPIKHFKELADKNLLTRDEYQAFNQSRQFLCRVRAHLHYLAGHAEERLTFDRQYTLAFVMGYGHPSINRAIERFMRRYFVAVRTVGSTTRIFCALLEEEKKRKPRQSLAWLWDMPWKLGNFRLDGERLNIKNEQAFEQHPALMLELFRVAQMHELDIHPRALQLIARHVKRIDDSVRGDAKANALFLDMLLSKQNAEATLRRMSDAGVLGRFIPDFGRVVGQTQFNMYHVYTVDEHTLVALGILHALEKGTLKNESPLASLLIHRIKMRRALYLALFCHDIAKGRGGDHSALGEKIAARLAARLGLSPHEIDTVAWLVRHHLLFTHTAFKRDINDPKTIQDFVSIVQSPERLKLLLVLSVADMRATAPTVWNVWKGALMRDLYARAEQCLGAGKPDPKQEQTPLFQQDLLKLLPGWQMRDIDHYLEQGNPAFWSGCDLPRHAVIARMLKQSESMPLPLLMDTQHDYERSVTEITLCTLDQQALFSKLAGAMALAGANIINAKIFTLKNGIAVDIFQVQDAAGDVFDRPDRLAKLSVYIEQVIAGELELGEALAKQPPSYMDTSRNALKLAGQVFIENNASNIHSVIELSGRDRAGFLYQVTRVMAELGLSIVTAHISTFGTQAADVFYVKDLFGMKITHEGKMKEIREKLLQVINAI